MGRGRGGFTNKKISYTDSGGNKVTDKGSIFVAERYIDDGYEAVFRQKHEPNKTYNLTIKTSNDKDFIKNIEVKQITSNNASKIAARINEANQQISREDTIAIVLAKHKNDNNGRAFAKAGINEARRKGYIKGKIEVWFSDKTKIVF